MQVRREIGSGEEPGEVDGGPRDVRQRLCAVTRQTRAPDEMIRFVSTPDGSIVPDLACRLPGRGVWVTGLRACVAEAARGGAFARSLKRPATAPADLADTVEALMRKRVLAALALANKAGLVVAGFGKIEAKVAAGKVAALLHGASAAADGAAKLDRRYRAVAAAVGSEPHIMCDFEIEELSLALGRSNVVHAALIIGGASSNFLKQAERLRRYRHDGRLDDAGATAQDGQACAQVARTEQV